MEYPATAPQAKHGTKLAILGGGGRPVCAGGFNVSIRFLKMLQKIIMAAAKNSCATLLQKQPRETTATIQTTTTAQNNKNFTRRTQARKARTHACVDLTSYSSSFPHLLACSSIPDPDPGTALLANTPDVTAPGA